MSHKDHPNMFKLIQKENAKIQKFNQDYLINRKSRKKKNRSSINLHNPKSPLMKRTVKQTQTVPMAWTG